MNVLIFGGTGFFGRHLVEAALNKDHQVTLFNRGTTGPELFPRLEKIKGDRDRDLALLQGRRWDSVIDTCGHAPRTVQASATLLAAVSNHYTFISSTSVYSDFSNAGMDEHSPLIQLTDGTAEEQAATNYGAMKALCEQAVETTMPGHTLIIRPGLIVGPHDPTDRFTYWPHRVALGGEVLAPAQPEQPVQFIDVRDLAEWTIQMVEKSQIGIYNAKGPAHCLTMQHLLNECRFVSRSNAHFTWVNEDFLLEHNIIPYKDLPLWVPSDMPGFATVNCSKALAAGLTFRPLSTTIQAVLDWDMTRSASNALHAGLKHEREAQLLQAWHRM